MESKTKHRILGLVVVAGFAVLMYPFLLGGNSVPKEQALVKAPPFPDQAIQLTTNDKEDVIGMPAENESVSTNMQPVADNQLTAQPNAETSQNQSNVETISNPASPAPVAEKPTAVHPLTAPASDSSVTGQEPAKVVSPVVDSKPAKIKSIQKKISGKTIRKMVKAGQVKPYEEAAHIRVASKSKPGAYINLPLDSNGLMALQRSAYVIQLGSFKQKSNALRLVNKLRANGYRAFIQHVEMNSGENTRVFVGPEHQQASARKVATQLEKDMKLHGIVISYQPFTL